MSWFDETMWDYSGIKQQDRMEKMSSEQMRRSSSSRDHHRRHSDYEIRMNPPQTPTFKTSVKNPNYELFSNEFEGGLISSSEARRMLATLKQGTDMVDTFYHRCVKLMEIQTGRRMNQEDDPYLTSVFINGLNEHLKQLVRQAGGAHDLHHARKYAIHEEMWHNSYLIKTEGTDRVHRLHILMHAQYDRLRAMEMRLVTVRNEVQSNKEEFKEIKGLLQKVVDGLVKENANKVTEEHAVVSSVNKTLAEFTTSMSHKMEQILDERLTHNLDSMLDNISNKFADNLDRTLNDLLEKKLDEKLNQKLEEKLAEKLNEKLEKINLIEKNTKHSYDWIRFIERVMTKRTGESSNEMSGTEMSGSENPAQDESAHEYSAEDDPAQEVPLSAASTPGSSSAGPSSPSKVRSSDPSDPRASESHDEQEDAPTQRVSEEAPENFAPEPKFDLRNVKRSVSECGFHDEYEQQAPQPIKRRRLTQAEEDVIERLRGKIPDHILTEIEHADVMTNEVNRHYDFYDEQLANLRRLLDIGARQHRTHPDCILCGARGHVAEACPHVTSIAKRKELIVTHERCRRCAKTHPKVATCKKKMKCKSCEQYMAEGYRHTETDHPRLFCPLQIDRIEYKSYLDELRNANECLNRFNRSVPR